MTVLFLNHATSPYSFSITHQCWQFLNLVGIFLTLLTHIHNDIIMSSRWVDSLATQVDRRLLNMSQTHMLIFFHTC